MPRCQLDFIGLQSCQLGTQFPQWLQTQREFSFIDISRANISDVVPDWFWNRSAKVYHIDLSHNYFRGEVPEFTESVSLTKLDLSGNNLHGPLPHFSPKMMTLDLAENSFNGTLAPVCESLVMNNSLGYLDLSSNFLSGQLSDCWRYGKNLEALILANNSLSGEIPHSIGYLANLIYLQLQGNIFSKNLPSSLENIAGLEILDVSENRLSGNIPFWIGESLKRLMILKLSRNKLDGNIPWQICQFRYLYDLDLSSNALSGTIPRCFKNLHTLSGVEEAPSFTYGPYADYRIHGTLVVKGRFYVYDFSLPLRVIDLAENHLSGEVPSEITSLIALRGLNLSRNSFTGTIPRDIANMRYLEFLDLSWNKLSCSIPPSIVEIPSLAFANFSFNGLTGKIPSGCQFATFENSSYVGNPDLCGLPVSEFCSDHLDDDITHCDKQEVHATQHGENNWLEEFSFYISMGIGFNTSFWVFWATLMLKRSWRYAYMRFLDNMGNKIYVFAAIRLKMNKQQRGTRVSNHQKNKVCPHRASGKK
ncbi:receptor-like protein EIX2 [Nicotiana tabacum]